MDAGRSERGADARRERPASDLHEHAVGRLTGHVGVGDLGHLPSDRPPAVEAQRVLRPLHQNGTAPRVDRLTEPQHGRVARRVVGRVARRW